MRGNERAKKLGFWNLRAFRTQCHNAEAGLISWPGGTRGVGQSPVPYVPC